MTGALLILALGVVCLIGGGEILIRGATRLAGRLGVPTYIVGLTVVAFGTSAPELALNIIAAANGNSGLSFGNIVGSNIANIGLILGLSALIRPMRVHSSIIRREMPLMIVATLVLVAMLHAPPSIGGASGVSRLDGLVLLAGFVLFCWTLYRKVSRQGAESVAFIEEIEAFEEANVPLALVMCVLGAIGLAGGGKLAETGAVQAAEWMGMSDELIGLTIVAVATSLPELAASLTAAMRRQSDLAVGNIVGSNIFNILLVMGATSLVEPVVLPAQSLTALVSMVLLSLLLWPLSITQDRRVSRLEGSVLLVLYVATIGLSVWETMRGAS
ncbi:MAG: calcium/sodium antiporter [Planctomycetota bacterium]|jgi:cation:H+ antiporter